MLACLPLPLLVQAATCFDDARTLLAAASQGTNRPEAPATIQALDTAIAQVGQVYQTAIEVQRLIEQYLAHIGAGVGPAQASTVDTARRSSPGRPRLDATASKLVADVADRGDKISPEKVVRIEKPNRIVWLEEGNNRAGLGHLLTGKRVADFARHGIG